ncbi:uncharacterized protein LOC107631084 [Arachis ipaensis]|uniref:uncharacterized protein LOC107631084 n=1 Tax=Arachis ipaensis TaxID=130454 RepID=UPI0007AF56B7|nr:uncharacterized protein LOC107631084 [Arachis ipaensis]XP_025638050.1 uncharacterized protein LOC112733341 [Arachis hypogaea]
MAHHLSYYAMHGTSGTTTIRVNALIQGLEVKAFIDGGSFDNFIQPRIVKFLNLSIQPAPGLKVMVGNFVVMIVEGYIPTVEISMDGCKVQIHDVFVLHVAGGDLIIGTPWLRHLRAHIVDYDASFIRFLHEGNFVTVHGEKPALPQQAQFHIRRLLHMNAIAKVFTLELHQPPDESPHTFQLSEQMEPELITLLHAYAKVFQLPSGLPPKRFQDHSIPLIPGAASVKVKRYRYLHSEKAQIEAIVQEIPEEDIIQPRRSPFSSPILLIKKKDRSWRFCTGYRALNNITVKDCFPIPTVDELLDELFGARVFSKLDLRFGYHQIIVKSEDRFKTAFQTPQGHYEWLITLFRFTNALATFQNLMNDIFCPCLRKFVLVFFDDILIYSLSWPQHLQHLE